MHRKMSVENQFSMLNNEDANYGQVLIKVFETLHEEWVKYFSVFGNDLAKGKLTCDFDLGEFHSLVYKYWDFCNRSFNYVTASKRRVKIGECAVICRTANSTFLSRGHELSQFDWGDDPNSKLSRCLKSARFMMAYLLEHGIGGAQVIYQAKDLYKQSDTVAYVKLLLGQNGQGLDFEIAEDVLLRSLDDMECCYLLGKECYLGEKFIRNYKMARLAFEKVVKYSRDSKHKTMACYHLGVMYLYGHDVGVDFDAATFWFKKAAHGGNSEAELMIQVAQRLEQKEQTGKEADPKPHKFMKGIAKKLSHLSLK